MDNNFLEIDTGDNIFENIPFEIAIIYERGGFISEWKGHRDGAPLFTKIRSESTIFFAETYGYYLFKEYLKQGALFTEDLQPITIKNIQPYYEAYANGFYMGYNDYNTEVEHSTALFNKDIQIVANRVFKTVTTSIPNMTSTGMKRKGDKFVKTLKKSLWQEAGVKAGAKYKAWYFIINNPQLFTDLFRQDKQMIATYNLLSKIYKDQPISAGLFSRLEKLIQDIKGGTTTGTADKPDNKPNDFTTKERALAYIFDLMVSNKQIPTNETEGCYDKKGLMKIGESKGIRKPDTFYRAVKGIADNYDINKVDDLNQISMRWIRVLQELSTNKTALKKYLKAKQLA